MKISLRKFQSGGGFPPLASIYTPVTVTNPYTNPFLVALTQQTQGATKSKSDSSKSSEGSIDDATKLLKDLDGLDNDVQKAIGTLQQQANFNAVFGDSSDVVSNYYQNLQILNKVKQSNEEYKSARDISKSKNGLGDIATTSNGLVAMKNSNTGEITFTAPETIRKYQSKGYQLLTNGNLLYERAHSPNYTFQVGDNLSRVVAESSSMEEIQKLIKDFSSNIGYVASNNTGYIQKEAGQIQQGIDILKSVGQENIQSMPQDGIYKIKIDNKSNAQQAKIAINAIYRSLTPGQRALLKTQTANGTDSEAQNLIGVIVAKDVYSESSFDLDYQKPDKDDSNGSSKGSSNGDSNGNDKEGPMGAWFRGLGEKQVFTITGLTNHGIKTKANIMPIINVDGKPLPTNSTLTDLSGTALAGGLDFQHASMGNGAELDSKAFDNVLIDNTIAAAELPVELKDGKVIPMVDSLAKLDQADDILKMQYNINITKDLDNTAGLTPQKVTINQVYAKVGLPPRYNRNGTVNDYKYRRFAMVKGTTTEKSFKDNNISLNEYGLEASDSSRAHYVETIKTKTGKDKFSVNNGFFGLGQEEVYEGTIFIPMTDNYEGVAAGSGSSAYKSSQEWNALDSASNQNKNLRASNTKLNLSKFNQ